MSEEREEPEVEFDQLTVEDMLMEDGTPDVLDEGYSPPDREPAEVRALRRGTDGTVSGELAAEDPEVWSPDYRPADSSRAGRLVVEADLVADQDVFAQDTGIGGGAAAAEEAAMHVETGAQDEQELFEEDDADEQVESPESDEAEPVL